MENYTWDHLIGKHIETPKEMIDFFNDIDEVCKKHGLSISHEDGHGHGSFEIEKYNNDNMMWIRRANKCYVKENIDPSHQDTV